MHYLPGLVSMNIYERDGFHFKYDSLSLLKMCDSPREDAQKVVKVGGGGPWCLAVGR